MQIAARRRIPHHMNILAGTRLGRYEIRKLIGAGGMGEVYLAEDTKLGRNVALKILPATVDSDPQRLRRFIQEARAASSLKHPNVAHIYEIEEDNGRHFIAMEHVEGNTLDELIRRGPLGVDDVAKIGSQLADALDEAHTAGIIHRDIKPSNIIVTARGNVKVLDFGLAKINRPSEATIVQDMSTQLMRGHRLIPLQASMASPGSNCVVLSRTAMLGKLVLWLT